MNARPPDSLPRVILWGPGQVGVGALRAVIAHPGLDLVGVVVHSDAKHGKDAGDLCGMPATGVIATPRHRGSARLRCRRGRLFRIW